MFVFISYSHHDAGVGEKIGDFLSGIKINYFLDRKDIGFGDSIPNRVHEAFSTATHLIVIVSPGSAKSIWVPYEIGIATGKGIKILPVLTHPAIDIPHIIRDLRYFESVEEFMTEFSKINVNSLKIDVTVKLCWGRDLGLDEPKLKGKVGFVDIKNYRKGLCPAIVLIVKNRAGRIIKLDKLDPPSFNFKSPQDKYLNGYTSVGFFIEKDDVELVPNAEKRFIHFGIHDLMRGIVDAITNDNLESITISDADGFDYKISGEEISTLVKQAREFYSDFDWKID